jgi:hypothetical protein
MVGRLSCEAVSDGQMTPPWEPPLAAFFTPAAGVPDRELHAALTAEGRQKTTRYGTMNPGTLRPSAPEGTDAIRPGLRRLRVMRVSRGRARGPAGAGSACG